MRLLRMLAPIICVVLVATSVPTSADAAGNQKGTYFPLAPARLLDTATSNGGHPSPLGPGSSLDLTVTGRGGLPTTGVAAVVINLTVASGTAGGYLAAWPSGQTRPTVSSINFHVGEVRANIATVAVGAGGKISIFNAAGTVRVVVDVVGYYSSLTTTSKPGNEYVSQDPDRLADTRASGAGQLAPGDGLVLYVDFGDDGSLSQDVHAVALNITAVGGKGSGYLSAWDGGNTVPRGTSTVNFSKGATIPNMAVVKTSLCTDPDECDTAQPPTRFGIFNGSQQPVDVIVDLVGFYFNDGTLGLRFTPLVTPKRISDSRSSTNGSTLTAGQTQQLVGPSTVLGSRTESLVTNVTAVRPTTSTYLTLWDTGPKPATSNLNAPAGSTVANGAVVDLSSSDTFNIFNSAGTTDFVVDVTGRFDLATAGQSEPRTGAVAGEQLVTGSQSRRLSRTGG